jgi:hypothetical protein
MEMAQMLECLLAGQKQILARMEAQREKLDAMREDMKAWREEID